MAYISDPTSPEAQTPLMKQFYGLKAQCDGAIMFFRMGDFYELFAEDAVLAAPILGITLTSRDRKSENPMPMAGVPFHSAQNYIQKLLNAGKKVAIAEQFIPEGMTTDQIKGIVERRLIRTFTPAVQFELSETSEQKFLATVIPASSASGAAGSSVKNINSGAKYIIALFDPATGWVRISTPLTLPEIFACPLLGSIRHFLNASSKTPIEFLKYLEDSGRTLIEEIPHNWVSDSETLPFLQKQYQKQILPPLLENAAAQKALSLLIQYTLKTQGLETFPHLHEPQALFELNKLSVGPNTHAHLDTADLFHLINKTSTSMGSRSLRQQLEAPLKSVQEIEVQQEAVMELAKSIVAPKIQAQLKEVYDLDRILGRVATKLANPRDTYSLGKSLKAVIDLAPEIASFKSKKITVLSEKLSAAKSALLLISEQILKEQKSDAPIHTRDGGIFNMGTSPELDRLITLSENGERFIIDLETRERAATGISSLKIKYNRVFGYFIEISSANLAKAPAHYQRKQTMVGGERFYTEELKKFEEEILTASSKQKALENSLFQNLIESLIALAEPLKVMAELVGELDSLISISLLAHKNSWSFPVIDESQDFILKGSRHPVVDSALFGKFVSNDVTMSATTALTLIITGPNMGGKSTLMRQMAQIILLGQMGAPVPATEARWGVFHSLFTRIGAQDAIAKGQSTFMVEMVELAHILNHADSRSFIVLDEIGRGTSTYDGMSVASSSLEYLHQNSGARIVFATHYHELTGLEEKLPLVKNAHMKVTDDHGKLTFLYELAPGRSSKSFGIQVAELAGIPKAVIKQAWNILKQLEEQTSHIVPVDQNQLSLFSQVSELPGLTLNPELAEFHESLQGLDLNVLRPIDALNLLSDLKTKLKAPS